ncbi:hypothetical protein EMPG_12493 [Blastomyces silverae]|uniref:Cyanovirin-N domain-containing protein n=1 Tax=Blastomyces silverae TaxID=2060906 RepID=A0A0H1BTT2_9EURO|nr:hypothetical protein EMPG_12493 [Blastomyces silverae]
MVLGNNVQKLTFKGKAILEITFIRGQKQDINLDNHLGSYEGKLIVGGNGLSQSATSVGLDGSILKMQLPYSKDGVPGYTSATLNLGFCFHYNEQSGEVSFKQPSGLDSCSNFHLEAGHILRALCLGRDGLLHESSIDLNSYLGAGEGEFIPDGRDYMNDPAHRTKDRMGGPADRRQFYLDFSKGLTLCGWISANRRAGGPKTEIDLSKHITNGGDGKLVWQPSPGIFDRDGPLAKLLDPMPLLGYITAIFHKVAGNKDHSRRAIAKTTGATFIYGGCLILSLLPGVKLGIIATAVIAAALTPFAIKMEELIAKSTIDDKEILRTIETDGARYVRDAIFNSIGAGTGAYVSKFFTGSKAALKNGVFERAKKVAGKYGSDYFAGNATTVGMDRWFNEVYESIEADRAS